MSFLGPIESKISRLLGPIISDFAFPPEESSETVAPTSPNMGNSQSTVTVDNATTSTVVSVITASPTSAESTVSAAPSSATITVAPTTRSTESTSSSTEDDDATSSTTDSSTFSPTSLSPTTLSPTTLSPTTLITSTTSSSSASSTLAPAAPSAAATPQITSPAQSNSSHSTESNRSKPAAGVIVAIILAVALVISLIWLMCRFCPPVRRQIDAWSARRREERSYREAGDGPVVLERNGANSLDSTHSKGHDRDKSIEAAVQIGAPVTRRPLSFLGVNIAAGRGRHGGGYSWRVQGGDGRVEERGPIHRQYVSPTSAGPADPRGHGLGLGRISLLRNHSLLRKRGHNTPPASAGPSMTQAQAEIAGHSHSHSQTGSLQEQEVQPGVVVKKKPPPLPLTVKQPPVATTPRTRARFSYETNASPIVGVATRQTIQRHVNGSQKRTASAKTKRNSALPDLNVQAPDPNITTPMVRSADGRSQIGLAVLESPMPAHERFGFAR